MFNDTPEFEQDVASPTVSHNYYGNPKMLVATPGTLEHYNQCTDIKCIIIKYM